MELACYSSGCLQALPCFCWWQAKNCLEGPLEGNCWPACSAGGFHISIECGDGLCTVRQAPLSHLSRDAAEKWEASPIWLWPHWGPFCTRQNCCSKHLAWDLGLAALQEQIYWWGLSEPLSFLSINTMQHMCGVTGWHVKLCSCPSAAVSSFVFLMYFSRSHPGHSVMNSSSLIQSDWE